MFSDNRTDEVVLAAERVRFGYGAAPVLCDVSLALRRGEMVALLGRNGVGKSTLLRLLSGVLTPSDGTVCLDGVPLQRLGHRQVARRLAVGPPGPHGPFS